MSRYQAQVAEQNKQLEREGAEDAIRRGQDQQRQLGRDIASRVGAQTARMAANNIDVTMGSAARTIADTEMIGREDMAALSENIDRQVKSQQISAWNYESQKRTAMMESRQARTAGMFAVGTTLLGGATQYAGFKAQQRGA
ncbi:hypothetical protein [Qipengyuania sp. 902]|uniref:hypothetical protein n=1 Tax=Qipengyuania sp. 902 TaxID=3417565 RepID=UPI003EC03C88